MTAEDVVTMTADEWERFLADVHAAIGRLRKGLGIDDRESCTRDREPMIGDVVAPAEDVVVKSDGFCAKYEDSRVKWFLVTSGENAGRPRLTGWTQSPATRNIGRPEMGWVEFSVCPLCSAMVAFSDSFGDMTWAHEQWHAATDFPVPDDLFRQEEAVLLNPWKL